MCVLVVVLFWRTPEVSERAVVWGKGFHAVVLVFFTILPALSLVDLWDSYLSFALYAGNQRQATIYMADDVAERLPEPVQEVVSVHDSGVDTLDVEEWSYAELHAPPYAETRVFKAVGKRVCRDAGNPTKMVLSIEPRRRWWARGRRELFTCAMLQR